MRLGVTIPDGSALTGDALIAFARLAESIGFDSVWCFDAIGRGFTCERCGPSSDSLSLEGRGLG
jgi:alkanesulfonate monooxygenase SsuD/methylene tetrahydromethanopterin reductase-like flavin-dependent oxidoreductase (luciferase family)